MSEWIDFGLMALISIIMSLVAFLILCAADRLLPPEDRLRSTGCLFLSMCWPVGLFVAVAIVIYSTCKFSAYEIYRRIAGGK